MENKTKEEKEEVKEKMEVPMSKGGEVIKGKYPALFNFIEEEMGVKYVEKTPTPNDKIEEIMKEFDNKFYFFQSKEIIPQEGKLSLFAQTKQYEEVKEYFRQSLLTLKSEVDKGWEEKIQERIVLLYKQEEKYQDQYLHKDAISQLKELLK